MSYNLSEISCYVTDKVLVSDLQKYQYISTDNMVVNHGGIVATKCFPTVSKVASFKKGDILISNIRPYFKKIWHATFDGGCSNDVLVIRAKKETDDKFLYYVLSSDDFFDYATATSKDGTKMPRGDKVAIMKYQVPDLVLEQQQKIAKILSALDEKIELNNKINENLHAQAQAIFSEYYNKGTEKLLGDVVNEIESGSRQKGGAVNEGVPSIGAEKIERFGIYDFSKEKYISNEFFNKLKKGVIKNGDVLLYKDGAYTGKVSMALNGFPYEKCAVNEHVFIIRGKENYINQFYLYFCLFDNDNKAKIHSLASSKAAQPGLNQEELKSLIVKVPSVEDMLNFEKTVSPMMNMIAYNAIQNQKLAQIRDTLLPKLMSGELEV